MTVGKYSRGCAYLHRQHTPLFLWCLFFFSDLCCRVVNGRDMVEELRRNVGWPGSSKSALLAQFCRLFTAACCGVVPCCHHSIGCFLGQGCRDGKVAIERGCWLVVFLGEPHAARLFDLTLHSRRMSSQVSLLLFASSFSEKKGNTIPVFVIYVCTSLRLHSC